MHVSGGSVNYRIDDGTHAHTSVTAQKLREQKENGSIHADIYDVLSIKCHIPCCIFGEMEAAITPGVYYHFQ